TWMALFFTAAIPALYGNRYVGLTYGVSVQPATVNRLGRGKQRSHFFSAFLHTSGLFRVLITITRSFILLFRNCIFCQFALKRIAHTYLCACLFCLYLRFRYIAFF